KTILRGGIFLCLLCILCLLWPFLWLLLFFVANLRGHLRPLRRDACRSLPAKRLPCAWLRSKRDRRDQSTCRNDHRKTDPAVAYSPSHRQRSPADRSCQRRQRRSSGLRVCRLMLLLP